MHIGIAAPIAIDQLKPLLPDTVRNLPPGLGGIAVNNIISGLWERGHTLSVFALQPGLSAPEIIKGDRIRVYICPYRSRAQHRVKDFFKAERNFLVKFMQEDSAEIIHAHWSYEFALAAVESGKPHLVTCHDSPLKVLLMYHNVYRLVRFLMAMLVFKKATSFTTVSPYMEKELQPFLSKPVAVIPNVLPHHWFNQPVKRNPEESRYRIMSVMNGWGKIKNPKTLLNAFLGIKKKIPEATLTIFGQDYGAGQEADQWAKKRGLVNGVTFAGYRSSDLLFKEFNNYDLFVHTSIEESFGMVLIEAMASRLPVLAGKRSGAVPWILDYGESGHLVNIKSAKQVTNSVIKAFSEGEYSHSMVEHAYQSVTTRFHPDVVISQYEKFYSAIINR